MIVAIDGPAAAGKSSTAKRVAEALGFHRADSGALYRAVTAACVGAGGGPETWREDDLLRAAAGVAFNPVPGGFAVTVSGVDQADLHGPAVTAAVSRVAQMPVVRGWVNARMRAAAAGRDIVVDGRDMGTAVFPEAEVKVYLVADQHARALRRLRQRGVRHPSEEALQAEAARLVARDALDAAQSVPAPDAVRIDTTHLTQEQQVAQIVALVRARRAGRRLPHVPETRGKGA